MVILKLTNEQFRLLNVILDEHKTQNTKGKKMKIVNYIILVIITWAIMFGAMLYATSPEVWYAGDPNYEQLVQEAREGR